VDKGRRLIRQQCSSAEGEANTAYQYRQRRFRRADLSLTERRGMNATPLWPHVPGVPMHSLSLSKVGVTEVTQLQ
jgi:hypothetical protein